MEGFSHIFDSACDEFKKASSSDLNLLFSDFRRRREIFGFIENGDTPPNNELIQIAKLIDETLYNFYLHNLKDRKHIGYGNSANTYGDYNNLDSAHIMMSTLLFHTVKEKDLNIVEVGGGYGNWLFLNRNMPFKKWTIIDLPHIGLLQRYYLTENNIDSSKYEILSAYDYTKHDLTDVDIVIGTHSLSEFSYDIFKSYFENIIKHSKYFLYCYQVYFPSSHLINIKNEMIKTSFALVHQVFSEENRVSNCLFVNKSAVRS